MIDRKTVLAGVKRWNVALKLSHGLVLTGLAATLWGFHYLTTPIGKGALPRMGGFMGQLPVTAFFLGILTLGGGVLFHVIVALGLGRRLRLPFWEIAGPLQWLLLLPPFSWYGCWKLHRRARELAQASPEVLAQFVAEAAPPGFPASPAAPVPLPPEIAQRRPTATVAIAAIIGVVFALQLLFQATEQTHLLVKMGALVASRVQAGEIWRLASCTFLHAGVMHFALNIIVLIAIGFQLERAIGSPRFVLIYAASALGGSLASMTFMHSVSVGASGAVWGLMAAQFVLAKYSKDVLPQPLQDAMLRSAGQNLMLNMLNSFRPGVDWAAHLGGGVVGAAVMAATVASLPRLSGFAGVAASEPAAAKPDPAWLRPLAGAGALALLLGLGLALFRGQVWQASAPPRYQRVELTGAGITAEIPSGLTLNRSPDPGPNYRQFSYGTIMTDPVVIAIQLPAQAALVTDMDGAYAANRKILDQEQAGGKSLGPVSERQIRGRRVLEKNHDYGNGLRLQSLLEITPVGFRRVDCLRRPGLAAEWSGVAEYTLLSMDPRKPRLTKTDSAGGAAANPALSEVQSRLQRAKAQQAKGDHAGAIAEYTRVIQLQPTLAEAFTYRGLARSANHDPSGALADHSQAVLLAPSSATALLFRAYELRLQRNFDRAIADCSQAIELNPKDPNGRIARGRIQIAKGDLPAARADFDQAIELAPTAWEAFHRRATVREALGDFAGALADYDQVLAHPLAGLNYTPLHRYLVLRRLAQPDPTGWLTQTIAPWPNQWTTTLGRFLIGAITEDDLLAATSAAAGRRSPERECEAYYFAGMVRLLAREPSRAREYFEKSVATQLTHFPAYTLARAELARLGGSSR